MYTLVKVNAFRVHRVLMRTLRKHIKLVRLHPAPSLYESKREVLAPSYALAIDANGRKSVDRDPWRQTFPSEVWTGITAPELTRV